MKSVTMAEHIPFAGIVFGAWLNWAMLLQWAYFLIAFSGIGLVGLISIEFEMDVQDVHQKLKEFTKRLPGWFKGCNKPLDTIMDMEPKLIVNALAAKCAAGDERLLQKHERKAEVTQDAQEISEFTRQLASERLLVRDFEVEDEQHATVRGARRELRDELEDSYSEAALLQHEVVSLQRRIPILEEARLAAEHAQRVAEQARRLADQDLEGLRLGAYQAKEEAKYVWEARESAAAEALAQHLDLASSNKHTQDLRNALEAEREQSALLQQELEDRLENARRAEREITQRFLTAQDDVEKSHEACRIIASERLATVTALEDQVTNLTDQLAQSQRSGEDLQERIKALTRDKDELTDGFNEEKAAMEKEICILKNKRQRYLQYALSREDFRRPRVEARSRRRIAAQRRRARQVGALG